MSLQNAHMAIVVKGRRKMKHFRIFVHTEFSLCTFFNNGYGKSLWSCSRRAFVDHFFLGQMQMGTILFGRREETNLFKKIGSLGES